MSTYAEGDASLSFINNIWPVAAGSEDEASEQEPKIRTKFGLDKAFIKKL